MASIEHSVSSFAERELELTVREAEINRRLAELARREQEPQISPFAQHEAELTQREAELAHRLADVERREQLVQRAEDALASQRGRLDSVRAEYESRRDALVARGRELALERDRLRDDRAQLVAQVIEVEERERAVASAEARSLVEHPPKAPPAPVDPTDEGGDWWEKQLHGTAAAG